MLSLQPTIVRRYIVAVAFMAPLMLSAGALRADNTIATIERVKGAIVAIGTYESTRTPPFNFRGTGFVVDDGTLVVTNAHVLPGVLDAANREVLGILIPASNDAKVQFREAKPVVVDTGADLVVLKIGGARLPALAIDASDSAKEGQTVLFTGFPIGTVLGPYPTTHRGMVAAITPIAIPQGHAGQLDPKVIRRLTTGSFPVLQLDATAYPGNSGSPVFDPETGKVLGVINMVLIKGTKESVLAQPSGITYAVPSSHLRDLLQRAR